MVSDAAAVALAMFDTSDTGAPSLLDELAEARAEVKRLTQPEGARR